jgi:hypothetical protein
MPLRTKYIQLVFSLNKPLRSCLGLVWVRQVDWEPDKFARVFSQSLLFHPRDRVCHLFFASYGKVHLGAAPREVKCDVQTDTRATVPKGWPLAAAHANAQKEPLAWEDDVLCTRDDGYAAVQVE